MLCSDCKYGVDDYSNLYDVCFVNTQLADGKPGHERTDSRHGLIPGQADVAGTIDA